MFVMMLATLPVHLGACAIYDAPQTLATKQADAALVARATHQSTPPDAVRSVQRDADWRLIWAAPKRAEPGIFFFRRSGPSYRFVDTWGGVAQAHERDDVVRWATMLKVPAALAQCFASKLVDEGP